MKITVVTVCYNAESVLKKTFNSVLNQEYGDYEYVVIDGNSTDNTVNIIKEYKRKFEKRDIEFRYISEPDKGIYDAMNKGILKANGKYVSILNSDDFFHNPEGIAISVKLLEDNEADYSYADARVLKKSGRKFQWKGFVKVACWRALLPSDHVG